VLVYIHGGAFISGGNGVQVTGREIADPTNLIRRMSARGKPLVVVNINYRLGPFGFLASKELAAFNQANGQAVGNYGLHDQRRALEWVSKFVGGFGGDAENITIAGGSAGGASCHWQAIFPERRFRRAILSSGTAVALGALPISRHQQSFDDLVTKFGQDHDDPLQALQSVAPNDLLSTMGGAAFPCIDGEWIKSGDLEVHQAVHDIPDLLVGWATFEVSQL
jgi:carboxylesterase type B